MIRRALKFVLAPTAPAFCLRVLFLLSPCVTLTFLQPLKQLVDAPLVRIYSCVCQELLGLLGTATHRHGAKIFSGAFSIEVVPSCTGLFVFWLYLCAVVAFPTTWRARLKGAILGAATIFGLNVVRIVSLFCLGSRYPACFDDLHLFVWQGIVVVIVSMYWYSWAYRSAESAAAA